MIRLCSSTLLRRKISKRKKRKKRKCSILKEGKCDAIFFWKKYGRFLLYTHIVFSKNPLWARYCQRIFPGRIPLLSFFLFFCRGSASYFLTKTLEKCARSYDNVTNGKKWQRQWCALRLGSGNGTRLCAVTEVYRRQALRQAQGSGSEWRLYTGGTWKSVGKMGKQNRRKMVGFDRLTHRKSLFG